VRTESAIISFNGGGTKENFPIYRDVFEGDFLCMYAVILSCVCKSAKGRKKQEEEREKRQKRARKNKFRTSKANQSQLTSLHFNPEFFKKTVEG
jgi:hypothetical protein